MWHATHDMWHTTHRGPRTLCQNFRSLALTVWELWCFEDIFTKDESLSQWMSDDAVCRTAPATPGLLNILQIYRSTGITIEDIQCRCSSQTSTYEVGIQHSATNLGKFGWLMESGNFWVSRQKPPCFLYWAPSFPVRLKQGTVLLLWDKEQNREMSSCYQTKSRAGNSCLTVRQGAKQGKVFLLSDI